MLVLISSSASKHSPVNDKTKGYKKEKTRFSREISNTYETKDSPISERSTSAILRWAVPWYTRPMPNMAATWAECGRSSSAEVGGRRASIWILNTLVQVASIVPRLKASDIKTVNTPKQKDCNAYLQAYMIILSSRIMQTKLTRINSTQMLVFAEGENQSTLGKTSQTRVQNQQTQFTNSVETRNPTSFPGPLPWIWEELLGTRFQESNPGRIWGRRVQRSLRQPSSHNALSWRERRNLLCSCSAQKQSHRSKLMSLNHERRKHFEV